MTLSPNQAADSLKEIARTEAVHVQKNGRDVAVVISPDEYARLSNRAETPAVRPATSILC